MSSSQPQKCLPHLTYVGSPEVPRKRSRSSKYLIISELLLISLAGFMCFKSLRTQISFSPSPPEINAADHFVAQNYKTTIDAYDPAPIRKYCSQNSWNASLVVHCDRMFGRMGDVKQRILACVRHGMYQGAGLIIPTMYLHSREDPNRLGSDEHTSMDYGFNRELFLSRLQTACPKMKVYVSIEAASQPGVEIQHFPIASGKLAVSDADTPYFAENFGALLTFPEAIYRLAFSALYTLGTQYDLGFPATNFLGVHLRSFSDAISAAPELLYLHYLYLSTSLSYPIVFVGARSHASVAQIRREAAVLSPSTIILAKDDLLSVAQLEELARLTKDQAALVDYIILERAAYFAGKSESAFSWSVALARTASRVAGGGANVCARAKGEYLRGGNWFDEWSEVSRGVGVRGFRGVRRPRPELRRS